MQIQFGPLVTYASGKIGGTVFAGFRGRKIAKRRAQRHRPPTEDQRAVELAMRHGNRVWRRMGETERIGGQGNLFDFYESWAYHQRHSEVPGQAYFLGQFVKFARSEQPAVDFPLLIGVPRHRQMRTFGVTFQSNNRITIGGMAADPIPSFPQVARVLLYWTDDYDPSAERASVKTGFRYFLSPPVTDAQSVAVQDIIPIPSGEESRTIIVGGAMYYFFGIRGTYATSVARQLEITVPPDNLTQVVGFNQMQNGNVGKGDL